VLLGRSASESSNNSERKLLPTKPAQDMSPQPSTGGWFRWIACCKRRSDVRASDRFMQDEVMEGDAAENEWKRPQDDLEAEWKAVERTISPAEFKKVLDFRQLVSAARLDEHGACCGPLSAPHSRQASTLLRYVRARSGDLDAALELFKGALDWRLEYNLDAKLKTWDVEWKQGTSPRVQILKKYTHIMDIGKDFYGLPVYLHRDSQSDLGGIVREVGNEALLLHLIHAIEDQFSQARARMLRTGHAISNFIEIHDTGNYGVVPGYLARGFGAATFFKKYAPVFDHVYPERVRICYLVRMPTTFAAIWSIFSPMVPPETKKKLRLKGQASSTWIDDMQENMPGEIIPTFLRCEDKQVYREAVPFAGFVPEGIRAELEQEQQWHSINTQASANKVA